MKFDISKQWCEQMGRKEAGHSISAGSSFAHLEQCQSCRGYDLERQWCQYCGGSGLVKVNQQPAGKDTGQ